MSNILYTLAKHALALDANHTAKLIFEKMRDQYIPPSDTTAQIMNTDFMDIYVRE